MKRIFLTSGLIVCMACPAFADLLDNQTIDPSGDAATCQYPTLEGYSGTSTFTAKWTALYQTITLDKNVGTTAATGGLSTENLTPTTLYSVPNDSHVWTGLDNNQNLTGNTGNVGYTSGDAGLLTAMPAHGIEVNYDLDANGGNIGTAVSTGDYRPYLGVYDQSGTTLYINTSGVLTSEGATAASNNTNGTIWYAKYDTVTPTVTGTPTRSGYTFVGWNSDQSATEALQSYPAIADNNTTLYAIWSADSIDITFDCGRPVANAAIPGGSGNYAVSATGNISADPAAHSIAMDDHDTITEVCTLQGWTFDGWSCTSGLTSDAAGSTSVTFISATSIDNGTADVYMKNASGVTCTAKWTPNTINLVWQDNNATTAHVGGDSTCTFDSTIGLPSQVPQRTGYEFGGWQVVNTAN